MVSLKIEYLLQYVLTEEVRRSSVNDKKCYDLYKDVASIPTENILGNNKALLIGVGQMRELVSFCKTENKVLAEEVCEPIEVLQYIIDELPAQDIIPAEKNLFLRYKYFDDDPSTAVVSYCYWQILQSDESVFSLLLDKYTSTEAIWDQDSIKLYWKIASVNNRNRWLRDPVDLVEELEKFLPEEIFKAERIVIEKLQEDKKKGFLRGDACITDS